MGLDRQRRRLAGARQFLQGARRAMHQIADAVDVEDDGILAVGVDHAFELADHIFPLPRAGEEGERSSPGGGKASTNARAQPPQAPSLPSPASGGGKMRMMRLTIIAQPPSAPPQP